MKKSCIAASSVWCFLLLTPFLFLKAAVQIEFGFYAPIYCFVYLFFESFEAITLARIIAILILTVASLLTLASFMCIICCKGTKIHAITIAATIGELLVQIVSTLLLEYSSINSFISPFCIFLLLIWLIYIRNHVPNR